ncbi:MAG: GNAT family N-acetyltransferase [Bacteroidales bacterium]|nr:GNAT family N-acetyltransferase [Bacteroidales bacterium]
MKPIIPPVDRQLIRQELTKDKFIRVTRKGHNHLYEVTAHDSPNVMQEIGRLREISFRVGGGGTGKAVDIDEYDIDPHEPYRQLIVWDPKDQEIIGGYRYIMCGGLDIKKMATRELFDFSDEFINGYMPFTIELGRSFVQPNYQSTNIKRKSLYALDNLWDGLGALIVKYGNVKYFFGKVTMYTSYNSRARNLLLHFLKKYFKDPESLVLPIVPLECDMDNPYFTELFKGLEYKDAYKVLQREIKNNGEHIPPLINSYMNLSPSMKVFGTAVNYGFGGVEETGILVSINDIYPEKIERYITPIRNWVHRIRVKWWKK